MRRVPRLIHRGTRGKHSVFRPGPGNKYNELPTFPKRPSFKDFQNSLRPASQAVVFDGCPDDPFKPSSTPIYQTSTFAQPSADAFGPYDYTRSGNPTRTALEKHVALLEQGHAAFAFSTGMSALKTVLDTVLQTGDELIVGDDIYGGMHRLISKVAAPQVGVSLKFVDTTDLSAVEAALTDKTRLVHIESPSNPMLRITDIRALSQMLRDHGVLLSIDATMMSPYLMKPLQLGADIVVHSATKFFGGHADAMGGFVVTNSNEITQQIAFIQNACGTALSPFDCWLFLRGIKTMSIRVEAQQRNAREIATLLNDHPDVTEVFYLGIPTEDPSRRHEQIVHESQALGPGSVLSFTTGSAELSRRFCDACRIFKLTVSFGSVNSLCEVVCQMSHASIDEEERHIPEDLVRLSIGIEDVEDLKQDIHQAFELAKSDIKDIRQFLKGQGEESDYPKIDGTLVASPGDGLLYDSAFADLPTAPAPHSSEDTP